MVQENTASRNDTPDSGTDAECESGSDDYLTTNTQLRFVGLGSMMSAFIIVSFFVLIFAVVFGVYGASLAPILMEYRYVLLILVLTAAGWIFGEDLIDLWKK